MMNFKLFSKGLLITLGSILGSCLGSKIGGSIVTIILDWCNDATSDNNRW